MDTYFIQLFCYFSLILFCGDITATYEMRDADKGVYYTDNTYSVDSAELTYKTASFHNFALGLKS